MSTACNTPHPLKRHGTSQNERMPEALMPGYVKIDERNIIDLLKQTIEYSNYINFFKNDNYITGNWNSFFESIPNLEIGKSIEEIIVELENSNTSPHLSLLICFLRLFNESVQQEINQLQEKHLRLFYEEILHIVYKKAVPDSAIIFGEIDKLNEDLLIPKGTSFLAGKDSEGNERKYKSVENVSLNKAIISDLKTIFVSKSKEEIITITFRNKANTQDGKSEPIITEPASWPIFGSKKDNKAEISFIISSAIFNLEDGKRTITFKNLDLKTISKEDIEIFFTTEKEWGLPSSFTVTNEINIVFEKTAPAFSIYTNEIHGNIVTTLPSIKIVIRNYTKYEEIAENIKSCEISINVEGCKNLVLSNELGEIDPAKPFLPFGSRPMSGSSYLLIGNNQAFNKYLTAFTFNSISKPSFKFDNLFQSNFQVLNNGSWESLSIISNKIVSPILKGIIKLEKDEFSLNTTDGFLKITLQEKIFDFKEQTEKYTSEVAKLALIPNHELKIGLPDIPELLSLELNYKLNISCKNNADVHLFQVMPFGYKSIKDKEIILPLLPNEGNLYIGIEQLKNGQLLSIHFQMLDGSNELDLLAPTITWAYLNNNEWEKFELNQIVKDTTLGLTSSGIIIFNIPDPAYKSTNTLFDPSKIWISASCKDSSKAIPKVIDIRSQAFEVIFDEQTLNSDHLKDGLASKTITKLEDPLDGLKKIEQPYPTFGGREKETYSSYITRTSEFLRHKNRAITIWDFERIILENFEDIYKVKCISHTTNNTEYAPGHVLLIVIPKFGSNEIQESLKPRVSIGKRNQIKTFLRKYHSPFIEVDVINPDYEELEVNCHVTFNLGKDKSYYSNVLAKDLKSFFAPWLISNEEGLRFNGELYQSDIINYIDERAYVHHIDFLEVKKYDSKTSQSVICDEHISSANQSSIFTSYISHKINPNMPC